MKHGSARQLDATVVLALGLWALPALAGPVTPPADAPGLAQARAVSDAYATVAAAVRPATVYIEAQLGPDVAPGIEELLRDYRPQPTSDDSVAQGQDRGQSEDQSEDQSRSMSGSGVIISEDGLVLTNHHVVAGAVSPTVTLFDRRSYPTEVVGSDARTDIALLRIQGKGPFPWAELGDSDAVRVGQSVLTIGHPFDFQFTVTRGIISARGRRNLFQSEIQDYLQTDAAMNPGSSGGPLFDLAGRVVGINTAIYTAPSGSQNTGISFAIPSSMARRVIAELRKTGRVGRASLGMSTQDRPASDDEPAPGVLVTHVTAGGAAQTAGLQVGDVILSADGERVTAADDLRALVLARGVGVPLELSWLRDAGRRQATVVTADERDLGRAGLPVRAGALTWAGATVVVATAQALQDLGLSAPPQPWSGLLVLSVAADSSADVAGLLPGDLLTQAGSEELTGPDVLLAVAADHNSLAVQFYRAGGMSWAALGGLQSDQR